MNTFTNGALLAPFSETALLVYCQRWWKAVLMGPRLMDRHTVGKIDSPTRRGEDKRTTHY